MGVTCIFWLVDVALIELYGGEWVTGPIVARLAMLFLCAFPLVPGAFMSCHIMDFPCEENFIDVGHGALHCLHELMKHLQRSWMCTNLLKSQFSHLQKAVRKTSRQQESPYGVSFAVSPGHGVTIPCIIVLLDSSASAHRPPRLARDATHRTA